MPSLELISMNATQIIETSQFTFDVLADFHLVSHRGDSSLFQKEMNRLKGVIYHLGSPNAFKEGEASTATDLFDQAIVGRSFFRICKFSNEFLEEIKIFLKQIIHSSPRRQALFTVDVQWGPSALHSAPVDLELFWVLHAANRLRRNTAYPIFIKDNCGSTDSV